MRQGSVAPYWNVDAQVKKDIRITESATFEFSLISTNIFNHNILFDPGDGAGMSISSPQTWGVLNSEANTPRKLEFGGRFDFYSVF
jgi:hypothetical protein